MLLNRGLTPGVMPEDVIFALDIGTRTIIGVVGVQQDERFFVHAVEIISHESRAMLDGQIHDISMVAQGVSKVKAALEKKLGYSLTKVSIAAAGRVLKTCQVKAEREIDEGLEIDTQLISALEMEGIQKAQLKIESELPQKEKRDQFYCVGYSVVSYFLNDYVISSLMGHKGNKAGVEVLATFLPQMVVDSLYTVLERSGLEVIHLTLEPIAALNLAIPKDLRLLNLALVDIGAGTSDIAITKSGTVVAYAMVPVAGDELTETIAQNYLVDFNTAEKIKVSLTDSQEPILFTDILDNQITVEAKEVNEVIYPVVEQLARTIAEKILAYNGGKPPNAIFLVGGGSQASGLCEALSTAIGLPKERVAVRNRSIAKNIVLEEDILRGPDSITPLGIMVTTAMANSEDFFFVTVNGSKVRMFNSRKMLVSDALILAGFNPDQLICKSGKNLKFSLNGKDKTVRGSFGKPAEISVNGIVAGLNTLIAPGDDLVVVPAEKGQDGIARVSDLTKEYEPIYLKYNDHAEILYPRAIINGHEAVSDDLIQQGDRVEIVDSLSLEEMAGRYEMDPLVWEFTVNGDLAKGSTMLQPGVQVIGKPKVFQTSQAQSVAEQSNDSQEITVGKREENTIANDIQSLLQEVGHRLAERDGITIMVNGKAVNLPPKTTPYIFIDIFNYIDFDLTAPKGIINLQLNDKEAGYTDIIKSGDLVKIFWKE